MNKAEYISASEVGDFVYCKRGWWLRIQGLLPTTMRMQQGTEDHDTLFQQLLRIKLFQQVLISAGVVLLIFILLLLLFR